MFLKNRHDMLNSAFLACVLLTSSSSLLAQTPAKILTIEQINEDTPAAASLALKERRYHNVVSITSKIAIKNPKSSSNWYLMSIASNRLGDFEMASNALDQAKSIDPKLGFASSPERVKILEKSISEGLNAKKEISPAMPAATATAQPASSASADLTSEKTQDNVIAGTPAPTFELSDAKAEEIEAKLNVIENKIIEIEKNKESELKKINEDLIKSDQLKTLAVLATGMVFIGFFSSLLFAVYTKRYYSKIKEKKSISVATMPLDKLIDLNRDNAVILLERLEMHGHKESALYLSTLKSLVPLQIESGKSRLEVKKMLNGIAVANTEKELEDKPLILGKDGSKDIHQKAAKLAIKDKIFS